MKVCAHTKRIYFRHPYGEAGEFHIVERCHECGARTSQDWIPHSRVMRPALLAVDPWMDDRNPLQGDLF